MTHTLSCITGGLFIAHHNEIRDRILHLSLRAFNSAYVHAKPLIHQGRTRSKQEMRQGSDKYKENQEDVMFQGLWYCQVNDIIDVKLGDADMYSYKYGPMAPLLARWETIKKDNNGNHCHDQRKKKSPFVLSV